MCAGKAQERGPKSSRRRETYATVVAVELMWMLNVARRVETDVRHCRLAQTKPEERDAAGDGEEKLHRGSGTAVGGEARYVG